MEALLLHEQKKAGRGASHAEAKSAQAGEEMAKAFLKKAADSEEKKYESVGLGWSYRYQGPGVVGSALAVNEKVVHMAFFAVDEADISAEMAELRRRRSYL